MSVSFVQFFVEEPSAEAAVRILAPKILGETAFGVHVFGGRTTLIRGLADRLRGYAAWLPEDWRIVVLLDEDRKDCQKAKRRIEAIARKAGLVPKPREGTEPFQVLTRLAVEELEAWYFGDVAALRAAYTRLSETLARKAAFRDPDAVAGGTWERLEQVLQRAGYHQGGLAKIQLARDVAQHMDPSRNRSHSFQVFRKGLRELRIRPRGSRI
ncbi:MAG: DUF4276 family protein [Deltaproteobacteria bacterium]|nr:DUF4276 family protein [Deltaproteobacteria bacterium]